MKHFLLPVILSILLSVSCVSTRDTELVYLTDSKTFALLPPSALETPLDLYQLFTFTSPDGEVLSVEVLTVADKSEVYLELFALTGQSIGSLSYDGKSVRLSSAMLPASRIKGEYLLADMELLFFPADALEEALEASGLRFAADDGARRLYDGDLLIWEALTGDQSWFVENTLRSYSYTIEVL